MIVARDRARTRPSRRLRALVPGIYHQRDARLVRDGGGLAGGKSPLGGLLDVLGGGLDRLSDAIAALWDDHFVERAQAEALPLIAELFRARFVTADPRVQRAVLARIVGWRRRKGTLATLEEVLSATSGWDVEADEGYRSLLVTQLVSDPSPWRGRTAVLWDPIGLSDPLTRRSLGDRRPRGDQDRVRGPLIEVLAGESIDDTVRRLGRIDAGHDAASPRTLDLRGWARPDAVYLRSSRLFPIEREGARVTDSGPAIPHGQRGYHVDPLRRDTPLVWLAPLDPPEQIASLTARHEPAPPAPPTRDAARLLTPTALADDPDRVEATGSVRIAIHGVPLVGPRPPRGPVAGLDYAPVGDGPVLRFAEDARPSPGDRWGIDLIAAIAEEDDPTIDDLLAIHAELTPAGPENVTTSTGTLEVAGRSVDLEITRLAGKARARTAAGVWSDLDVGPALGVATSNAAALAIGADTWIVRFERDLALGTGRLVGFKRTAGAQWSQRAVAPAPFDQATGIAIYGVDAVLLAVVATPDGMGAWAITSVDTTPVFTRLDDPAPGTLRPRPRKSPQIVAGGGTLGIHGGDVDGAAAGDIWSIPMAGGAWTPRPVYRQQERMGASLVAGPDIVALVGGDEVPGTMLTTVAAWHPSSSKSWRDLPPLPIEAGRPGTVVARMDGGGTIVAIVWADSTRPRQYTLAPNAAAWTVGPLETGADGCSPPEAGQALFVNDELLIVEPPPLPASDLLFVMAGRGHLAFLPRLDLPVGGVLRLRVANDGGTYERSRRGPGALARPLPLDSRFGGAFASASARARGGDQRYSLPGRLAREPWHLAQRSLGPWDQLVAPDDPPAVLLDPRLGRFVLPATAPVGPVTASLYMGRAGAIGPGAAPPDGALPRAWVEPDLEAWPAIDDRTPPTAYVDPLRAGTTSSGIGIHPNLSAAVAAAPPATAPRIAVLGSPTVAMARLTTGIDRGLAIWAADPGTAPVFEIDPDNDVSLALHVDETTAPPASGPVHAHLQLAGLWLPGRLELIVASGTIDVRYCTLGTPGALSLWIPGAGHQDADARWSIPDSEIELRLYGCMVGKIDLPPWCKLVAAGCTFDAKSRDEVAIRAEGAHVRLRQCTVYGGIAAGRVEASSCVFAGEVAADRPDLGFVRHSLLARGGRPPLLHASMVATASFVSARPTDPGYLALADNNGVALTLGENGGVPGAYAERGDHERELAARTDDFLPIAMAPVHLDRTTHDLYRLGRS